MNFHDLRVRDPYILFENGTYYLYRANIVHVGNEIVVQKSRDLVTLDEAHTVYTLDTSTWKSAQLWAPEVHAWRGKYYLFVSILGKSGLRSTEISVASTPDGPFLPVSDSPATPAEQSAIDGTLFEDEGVPYIVYSRDWPFCFDEAIGAYVGELWARPLTRDLSAPAGEAFRLFRSTDCPLSARAPACHDWEGKPVRRYGSDAPFLQRLPSGKILLTWSPIPDNNYVVFGAVADTIRGNWEHLDTPIFDQNGGHAMFFRDAENRLLMSIHAPEREGDERARFFPVTLTENGITLEK